MVVAQQFELLQVGGVDDRLLEHQHVDAVRLGQAVEVADDDVDLVGGIARAQQLGQFEQLFFVLGEDDYFHGRLRFVLDG